MRTMIYNLPGGITVEQESNFRDVVNPHAPKPETPEPAPEPTPDVNPEAEDDSPLVKTVKAIEDAVKPKRRRGRPKKTEE